jgi:hypothetical protein
MAKNMPKIAEVKLSTFKVVDFKKIVIADCELKKLRNCDCRSASFKLRNCGCAVARAHL